MTTAEHRSWDDFRAGLDGLPGGKLNIAYEAVDRHVLHGNGNRVALVWLGKQGERREVTYAELARASNRFANALRKLGVGREERVFALCNRIIELYVAALGTLKNGSVFCPLFGAFGPEPIIARVGKGNGKVLVTTESLYAKKVAGIRPALPSLAHVIVVGQQQRPTKIPETQDWTTLVEAQPDAFDLVHTDPEDMALLHFTSGTTGMPKGAVHVHEAVVMHHGTGKHALGLTEEDVYWCTADPGWVTGTSYGIVAPLSNGVTSVIDEAEFEVERWYRTLQNERVTVWYTAPTAVRMLMRAGAAVVKNYNLSRLRFVASVGEPLSADAVRWGQEVFGKPIHDNWWQTETGGIMIGNFPGMVIRPGSMGKPLPGIEAAIVSVMEDHVEVVRDPGEPGQLALRPGWPSMFRGYLGEEERYRKCFRDGWYLSGDLARRDADGYFWFVGRADDLIKTAGHLIGPFEVESALLAHPAVAEAGVIGKPDPVAMNIVKAFVALHAGYEPSDDLRHEIIGFTRKKLGAAVAPRELDFVDDLPKTRSGKIMRRLLRAQELGLAIGDTSTLEGSQP